MKWHEIISAVACNLVQSELTSSNDTQGETTMELLENLRTITNDHRVWCIVVRLFVDSFWLFTRPAGRRYHCLREFLTYQMIMRARYITAECGHSEISVNAELGKPALQVAHHFFIKRSRCRYPSINLHELRRRCDCLSERLPSPSTSGIRSIVIIAKKTDIPRAAQYSTARYVIKGFLRLTGT